MLEGGQVESSVRRISAEQEMFLVGRHMRPALVAEEVLSRVGDPRLTIGGQTCAAADLILETLLPLAREGLQSSGIDGTEIDLYLGTIEERVSTGQTGAQWALRSLAALGDEGPRDARLARAGRGDARAAADRRAHPPLEAHRRRRVGRLVRELSHHRQFMSTDLFTVRPEDLVDLAASVMDWRHIRHVPVEDEEGRLIGLVTHRDILRLLVRGLTRKEGDSVLVRDIMKSAPLSVSPSTPTLEAVELMRANGVGCMPVVEGGLLVGIVTAKDFLDAAARLFEERLGAT